MKSNKYVEVLQKIKAGITQTLLSKLSLKRIWTGKAIHEPRRLPVCFHPDHKSKNTGHSHPG
jgi:hypothetical protein